MFLPLNQRSAKEVKKAFGFAGFAPFALLLQDCILLLEDAVLPKTNIDVSFDEDGAFLTEFGIRVHDRRAPTMSRVRRIDIHLVVE